MRAFSPLEYIASKPSITTDDQSPIATAVKPDYEVRKEDGASPTSSPAGAIKVKSSNFSHH